MKYSYCFLKLVEKNLFMRKKDAIVYISQSVIDNWQVPSPSNNRGVNAVYSDNVFAIIYHLTLRLNISQQAAVQQLEHRKLIEEEVCSQATRSKRVSGIKKDKNNRKGFKNLVIDDEGYSFHRTAPHETKIYDIYKFQGDNKVIVKPNRLFKANTAKRLNIKYPAIQSWLSNHANEVHTLKSFLKVDDIYIFNVLIPYFQHRENKRKEKIIDKIAKLESIKNKETLMPKFANESISNNIRPKPNDEIKSVLVHFPYKNLDTSKNTVPSYLTAFWLTCHKTRLNYLLYLKENNRLCSGSRFSMQLKRTNKSLIVNLIQTKGTGRREGKTFFKATIKLPTTTSQGTFLSIDELEINSKGYAIEVDITDYGLTFPFEGYGEGISTISVVQSLGKWFKWINRYTNLENELYSYYHQLSPSDVTKFNAMPEFKQNPFTVFPSNPFVLPLI
jgi:hypothetical protein